MTREQEVEIISERYGANSLMYGKLHNDTLKGLLKHYQKGFVAGVKWADENPKSPWISVEYDLPCNNPNFIHFGFTNRVLVRDKKWNVFVAYMKKNKDNKWIWCSDVKNGFDLLSNITHWAYIHNLPKE